MNATASCVLRGFASFLLSYHYCPRFTSLHRLLLLSSFFLCKILKVCFEMVFSSGKYQNVVQSILLFLLSSAMTFVCLVFLTRSGHVQILTTVVERIHHDYPSTIGANCHCPRPKTCPEPKPSEELFPKIFQEVPLLRPINSTPEAAKEVDWESALLTPNGGFLMVEEWDHTITGYGVSMFHQLHCLTMM